MSRGASARFVTAVASRPAGRTTGETSGWRKIINNMFERLFDDLPALNTSAEDLKLLMKEMKESEAELDLEALAEWAEQQYA